MDTIRKTGKKATYFEGNFYLREDQKWANPINFPTVFVAYGEGIRSGDWQSCTAINTPKYVLEHYFDNQSKNLKYLFEYCGQLEKITWKDVEANKQKVLELINLANNELMKLKELKK